LRHEGCRMNGGGLAYFGQLDDGLRYYSNVVDKRVGQTSERATPKYTKSQVEYLNNRMIDYSKIATRDSCTSSPKTVFNSRAILHISS
jgi:hypothetical protein